MSSLTYELFVSKIVCRYTYKTSAFFFLTRLLLLLNTVELVSDLEDSLRRVEVILIQQPGLTANVKDIQHQIKVLQVRAWDMLSRCFISLPEMMLFFNDPGLKGISLENICDSPFPFA